MRKIVECKNVEKKYFLFEKDYKIIPWLFTKKGLYKEITPLKDINLTINEGDVIGFIGKNGAGKSTLMKIIAGITEQTGGSVEVNGVVNSLINLGAGFNQKLTGRQNIYYKGLLMGMNKEKIDSIIDEIIDFCELGDYFELPLYMYSSGMSARLGFSLAIFAEHDILIVDEVFSVGDKIFRDKSAKKMQELFKSGKSIIFASHDEPQIRRFCNRAIFLDESHIVVDGTVDEALEAYNEKYEPYKVKGRLIKYVNLDGFEGYIHAGCLLEKADIYREVAIFLEYEKEIELAYKYMLYAKHLRPSGEFILDKVEELHKEVVNDNYIESDYTIDEKNLDNMNRFVSVVNNEKKHINKADLYREIAIFLELEGNIVLAYKYMKYANEIRPEGQLIKDKLKEYSISLKNSALSIVEDDHEE